jgi:hypothetical protein
MMMMMMIIIIITTEAGCSSVSIAYWDRTPGNRGSTLAEAKDFFILPLCPNQLKRPTQPPIQTVTEVVF